MKYYIGSDTGSGQEFDNIQDFLDAISDFAQAKEENGEEWFEIHIED